MLAMIIDTIIILLLIGSIAYGYTVSRKVRTLVATLEELEPLVDAFSSAVDKSEQSVHHMRENIDVAERTPQPQPQPEPEPERRGRWEFHDAPEEAAFSSRRAAPEMPGLRVVKDKQDLVRKFFENTGATAKV